MMHYVITLMFSNGLISTAHGLFKVQPGMTRMTVYNEIVEYAYKQAGRRNGNVLFFSLEPEELTVQMDGK